MWFKLKFVPLYDDVIKVFKFYIVVQKFKCTHLDIVYILFVVDS